MASNGTQSGFGDAPAFPEEDALQIGGDLEEVARYARMRGNALRGTVAQRDAYSTPEDGLLWSNTTDRALDRYNGSSYDRVWIRYGWTLVSPESGWSAESGSTTRPEIRREANTAIFRGRLFGGTSGSIAAVLPSWATPTRNIRLFPISGSGAPDVGVYVQIETNGNMRVWGTLNAATYLEWTIL